MKKTTAQQDEEIIQEVRQNPFITAIQIRENMNLDVSDSVIRNRLKTAGYNPRKPAKKPALTPRHAEERLLYCRRNLDRDWSRVVFSDEKTFSSSTDVRTHVWRLSGTRHDVQNVRPVTESGRITLGFWGYMSSLGPGNLVRISPPRFTADRYIEVS